jgi:ribose transport system permease protein
LKTQVNRKNVGKFIMEQKSLLFILAIMLIMTFASPYFWTWTNIHNILLQTSTYGVLLVGTTFILIAGECDLSLGGNFCISGITVIMVSRVAPLPVAILAALAIGLLIGCVNGVLVVMLRAESFIITFGFGTLLRGICKVWTNAHPVAGTNEAYAAFGSMRIFGISVIVLIFLVMIFLGNSVLNRTQFGRNIYAIGGNFTVAEYSGINAKKIRFICYLISGVIGAFGGILFSARMNTGASTYGEYIPLMVNCSAVIGGTSFNGGTGSAAKSVSGILLLTILEISMNLLGIATAPQMLTKGLLIVFIIALDSYSTMKREMRQANA